MKKKKPVLSGGKIFGLNMFCRHLFNACVPAGRKSHKRIKPGITPKDYSTELLMNAVSEY